MKKKVLFIALCFLFAAPIASQAMIPKYVFRTWWSEIKRTYTALWTGEGWPPWKN